MVELMTAIKKESIEEVMCWKTFKTLETNPISLCWLFLRVLKSHYNEHLLDQHLNEARLISSGLPDCGV